MNQLDLAQIRLYSQHITQADFVSAHAVVSWMGAMQAQDYNGALWAIALRTPSLTQSDIEQAITDRLIVRTWPMRGTLHFVASEDVRWMCKLLTPRIISSSAGRRRELELDEATLEKAKGVLIKALSGGKCLSRPELFRILDEAGITPTGQRGIHILAHYSQLGLLCFGPHKGKQPTFVLLDEWIKPTPELSVDESLAILAVRYFTSHGPASLKDFAGWGTLKITDARKAIAIAGDTLAKSTVNEIDYWHAPLGKVTIKPSAFLLPGFDEFMLGYKDRSAALEFEHANKIVPGGNGVFLPTIVRDGQIIGTWKKTVRTAGVSLQLVPFIPIDPETLNLLQATVARYSMFLQRPVTIN